MIEVGVMHRKALTVAGCILFLVACVIVGGAVGDAEAASNEAPDDGVLDEHFLDHVRIENDGSHFRLAIPVSAPWAHWTLSDPPRIIIDIGQTTSRLARAPGLFQVRLDRGQVAALRTSQFSSEPLDRRVRITLELSRMVAHEVSRVGGEIVLLIPDPMERVPAALVLGSSGIVEVSGVSESVPPLALDGPSGAPAAPVSDPAPARTATPAEGAADGQQPARTLREALESALNGLSVESLDESGPDEALVEVNLAPETPPPPEKPAAKKKPEPDRKVQSAPEPPPAGVAHSSPGDPDPSWTRVSDELPPTILPQEAREQGASRLLKQGIEALLRGGRADRAEEALGRAYRFYGDTRPGEQSGILRRELLLLLERSDEAADLISLPVAPDTSQVPGAVYRALVQEYMRKPDMTGLERLLRLWGPSYGPVLETADLHLSLGEAFMLAGRLDLAESHILRIPDDDPAAGRGLLLLARAGEAAGDRARALDLYRRASRTAAGPYRARALARTADLEFQSGHVTAALQGYTRLLQSDPPAEEIPWGEYQLGNCNLLLGNEEAARRHYGSVAEKWPGSFWASFARERLEEMKWRAGFAGATDTPGGVR